jgi:hypothetical protein
MTLTQTLTPIDRLKRRLMVAYEFAIPDEQTLTETIYRQRAQAWQQALTEMAHQAGSRRTGRPPSGVDARYLHDVSVDDARSIRNTFFRDLDREIERLYAANPDGRRDYYVQNLTRWADERATWKDRQIALMNQKTAEHYAQQRFRDMNKIAANYRFAGPAPICPDCADKFAMGEVDQRVVDEDPTPLHPNCGHGWKMTRVKLGVALSELWVG